MDETGVTVDGELRKRTRVHIAGSAAGDVVEPTNAAPAASAYALPVRPVGGPTEATLVEVRDHLDTVETKLQSIIDLTPALTLSARMLAKQPATGYRLSMDFASTSFNYVAEAPSGSNPASAAVWRGIRIPLDASGNILGEIKEATGFTWDARASATWG